MKARWKRGLSLLLAVSFLISLLPMSAAFADSIKYGIVTGNATVKVRKSASTSSEWWFQLEPGTVVEVTGTKKSDGSNWFLVIAEHPDPGATRTYKGAIMADFCRMLTDDEEAAYLAGSKATSAPATATPAPEATTPAEATPSPDAAAPTTPPDGAAPTSQPDNGTGKFGKVNSSNTNFRQQPDTGAPYLAKLNRNDEVEILSGPNNGWYQAKYNNKIGYIMAQYVTVEGGPKITPTPSPAQTGDYVRLIKTSCHLRKSPGGQYDKDWEGMGKTLPLCGASVKHDGYIWYPVLYNGTKYYVRNDCVVVVGDSPTPTPPVPTATPAPTGSPIGTLKTIKGGVNFWSAADGTGKMIFRVSKGVTMPYYQGPIRVGGYSWYYAYTGNTFGYIRSDMVKVVSVTPGPTATPAPATPTPTGPAPTSVPTATPTPTVAPTPTAAPIMYVTTVETGCNLRKEPASSTVLVQIPKGVTLPVISQPVTKSKHVWYQVQYLNLTGWLRNDVVKQNSPSTPTSAPTATPGPTATPAPDDTTKFFKTTTDKVNLRGAPSKAAPSMAQVATGTVLSFEASYTVKSTTWYQVRYNGQNCWVQSGMGKVLSMKEYNDYIASKPSKTPEPVTEIVGYVKTTAGGLNLRSSCESSSTVLGRSDKGVVMPYLSEPVTVSGHVWYFVKHPKIGKAFVLSDFVTICDPSGKNTPTPVPVTPEPGKKEADYIVLSLGSSGTEVKNLVTELKKQGYYTGTVTDQFNTTVENAVKAFQKAKGINQDGIATEELQHELFGTVPHSGGKYNGMTLYRAEKIDWFTGGIQELWPKGKTFKIYDVKTGEVWKAYRWSGFNHVDAEPYTAEDTATLCRMYGVSNAKEIATKDLWQRRPSLVTIEGHTYACSLYGEPHNLKGNTIKNNNFDGQLCIHFTNSRTSDTNVVNGWHQEAIQYAWEHCPEGHK